MLACWMLQIWPISPIEPSALATHEATYSRIYQKRKAEMIDISQCSVLPSVARIEPSIGSAGGVD